MEDSNVNFQETRCYFGSGYFFDDLYVDEDDQSSAAHYGTPRHSGRYPWGSGENPYQHSGDWLAALKRFRDQGMNEKNLAAEFGLTVSELRSAESIAVNERKMDEIRQIMNLRDQGLSNTDIAKRMGIGESSVRSKIARADKYQEDACRKLANRLKDELEKKGVIDIGRYTNLELGVSETMLNKAVYMLEAENGYVEGGIGVKRAENYKGRGNQTNTKVLCLNDDLYNAAYQDNGLIKPIVDYTPDKNPSIVPDAPQKFEYPSSIDSKRVAIQYGDQGGTDRDGIIEIRPGVKDLSLGDSHYAQVRIMVDGERYLKGMAVYSDRVPEGYDILFNTNKASSVDKKDVLKKIKSDPDNPFGATIKDSGQSHYDDNGEKKLSAINKLKEEGDWDTANSKTLSSQFLSKQPMKLLNQQLNLSVADREDEFATYKQITNPAVKQKILMDFADSCDMAAVHMKAAALPRQRTQVLLPVPSLKENEIYAPNFNDGEQLAGIRYPHGGTFEIPILTVNNKNPEGKRFIGPNAKDAVGIHPKAAEKLSGADFDGDTAVWIPIGSGSKIHSRESIEGLKGFDPKKSYSTNFAGYKDVAVKDDNGRVKRDANGNKITEKKEVWVDDYGVEVKILKDGERYKGKEMGIISNLITDMTLRDASDDELARAVRHSMVVIDAPKHHLDYKKSERDNNIAELKKKYQNRPDSDKEGGASTLISRHKQTVKVPERRGSGIVDKKTGELVYKNSGRKYKDKKGNWVEATDEVPLLLATKDLRTLSSGTTQEEAYAKYGNRMKELANQARLEAVNTPNLRYSPKAKKTYEKEVKELNSALMIAKLNRPRERQAQAIANHIVKMKMDANDEMTKDEEQKMRNQAIKEARFRAGASGKKTRIVITDRQWEAIQAGAVSHSTVAEIFANSDQDRFKELALPKEQKTLSPTQINRIKAMASSGYTNAEIAERLGKSVSTISKYLTA